jgi:hypothetical protein
MTRLTMLFIAVVLVLPGAAFAAPAQDRGSPERDNGAILAAPGTTAPASALDEPVIEQSAAQRKAETVDGYYAAFRERKSPPAPAQASTPVATDGDGRRGRSRSAAASP